MGALHSLIIIPYYFVGTLTALPFLVLVTRLLRLRLSINSLVAAAIVASLAGLVVPLVAGWFSVAALTGRPLAVLLGLSFLFAAADFTLAKRLPLVLDNELVDL